MKSFLIALGIILYFSIHLINEGHVGVYKNLGVVQKKLAKPGFHFVVPFMQQLIQLSVTIQTDIVTDIPCGTSNGTLVYFKKVEVVNKLKKKYVYETVRNYTQDYEKYWITDRLHHQINQFCSKHTLQQIYIDIFDQLDQQLIKSLKKDLKIWAPGIQILSIRLTKPVIPKKLQRNFERMQKKKIDYFIEIQKQKVQVQEQMTIQKKAIIKAQSKYDVKIIRQQKKIKNKQNSKKIAEIEAMMIFEKQKTLIDAQFLAAQQEAQLLPKLYNQKYLQYLISDAFSSNSTFTIGQRIPNIYISQQ